MFSQENRCLYRKNPLGEVVCQLRFPEILTIDTQAPAQFQETIRLDFPHYASRKEPVNLTQPQQLQTNHAFVSADGTWRVNLTRSYLSLSCCRYVRWEDFAKVLDKPLAAFIQIYKPALFSRVSLRYLNFLSRKAYNMENYPFRDLIDDRYLGILADDEVAEQMVNQNNLTSDFALRGGCRCRLHAGPGLIRRNNQPDPEIKFIFDIELYMDGSIPVNHSAGALETLHSQAFPIFRDAITETLHQAMEPERI